MHIFLKIIDARHLRKVNIMPFVSSITEHQVDEIDFCALLQLSTTLKPAPDYHLPPPDGLDKVPRGTEQSRA